MATRMSLRNPFGSDNPVTPRRHLVLQHERRLLQKAAAGDNGDDGDNENGREGLPELKPGEEQLKSFYEPSLPAGTYSVTVAQTIVRTEDDKIKLKSHQDFTVDAPQIALPSGAVHSTYPPQGHSDTVDVLPHVVLNDPHLPWERNASNVTGKDAKRNKVPWLALLVFTQDELRVPASDLSANFGRKKQSDRTLTIHATCKEIMSWKAMASPLKGLSLADKDTVDVVLLKSDLFTALVTRYQHGTATAVEGQGKADVSRYRFLAHVRNINTEGMAEAVTREDGLFSIVVSHRIGPLDTTQPTTMAAHLVSIEGVESMVLPIATKYVGLCSLHSWTYASLPAGSLTSYDLFAHIGQTLDLLRMPESFIDAAGRDEVSQRIASRLRDGYTLTKYHSRTGEVTAAITRGPFTPTVVPHPVNDHWKNTPNSGDDLQILDSKVGLMDISYSAAWNLGKAMAVADQNFATALGRLRSMIFDKTVDQSKKDLLKLHDGFLSREDVLRSMPQLATNLAKLRIQSHDGKHHHRWLRRPHKRIDLSLHNRGVRHVFAKNVHSVTRKLASSADDGNGRHQALFNGHNQPVSEDWAVVLNWVMDRMYFFDILAHVLIPDPGYLPQESLRFFHIDANWVDAFVDGALSVANHTGSDKVRSSIKEQINEYLRSKHDILRWSPQLPTFGFLMRSKLVKRFPDLRVTAARSKNDLRAPILRLENIDEEVMLCLFDRLPSATDFSMLTFTQPPHQQCFSIAALISKDCFETVYKRVHEDASETDSRRDKSLGSRTWSPDTENPVFVWGENSEIRTLLFPAWSRNIFDTIKKGMQDLGYKFEDECPSAALSAIQLSSSVYHMPIKFSPTNDSLPGLEKSAMKNLPRALKLIEVKGWVLDSEPIWDIDSPEHNIGIRLPSSRIDRAAIRGSGSMPMMRPSHLPQPHFQRVTNDLTLSTELVQAEARQQAADDDESNGQAASNLATVPAIAISVHAWGKPTGSAILTGTGIPQDLIFGVSCTFDTDSSYRLQQLRITVALGDTSCAPATCFLTANYHGPGATMLANLRLCPRVKFGDGGESLNVLLVPRSRKGSVPVQNVASMSFVLPQVEINEYEEAVDLALGYRAEYDSTHVEGKFGVKLVPT